MFVTFVTAYVASGIKILLLYPTLRFTQVVKRSEHDNLAANTELAYPTNPASIVPPLTSVGIACHFIT